MNVDSLPLTSAAKKSIVSDRQVPVAVGLISGLTGLVVFLVMHAIWITPIWFISIIGIIVSAGGGIVTARCYERSTRLRIWRPFSSLYVFSLVGITLLPCVLLIQMVPPLLEAENGEVVHPVNMPWVVSGFFLLLLIPAATVGWLVGRFLTGSNSSAVLYSSMGLLVALGPGHNLPLFGDATGEQLFKALMLTFTPMAAAAVVMAEGSAISAMMRRR